MRFDGQWDLCDDGVTRPVLRGEVRAQDGSWRAAEFLVDTGADRTVLSANVLHALHMDVASPEERIAGVGGLVDIQVVDTQILLTRENDEKVLFHGRYAACPEQESLDMSVMGRDILDLFAVIVDRKQDRVCLVAGHHGYQIIQE